MKKTKIVATLGPACDPDGVIESMIREGVNVFRLNFSHGTSKDHARRVATVRQAAKKLGLPIAILQDISGPKIRIGEIENRVLELRGGDRLTLTTRRVLGSKRVIGVNYRGLTKDVKEGNSLFLADGLIEVEVEKTNHSDIQCRVLNSGRLTSHQGINFPGGTLRAGVITEKDKRDLKVGVKIGVDMVALSFVRDPRDIGRARRILGDLGVKAMPLVAKIEKHEALSNLDAILEAADGAMVARGDLGVEIPLEQVPLAQRKIIQRSRQTGRCCIVATHMLASMVNRPRPTRAEVADITTAVLDGADALMLSEETAVGHYPIESVRMMAKIIRAAEASINHRRLFEETAISGSVSDSISQAACLIAEDVKAKAVLTPTAFGKTAIRISRFRPSPIILALSHNHQILRFLSLYWGVFPVAAARAHSLGDLFKVCVDAARQRGFVKKGDLVVITGGVPLNQSGSTNLIRVQKV